MAEREEVSRQNTGCSGLHMNWELFSANGSSKPHIDSWVAPSAAEQRMDGVRQLEVWQEGYFYLFQVRKNMPWTRMVDVKKQTRIQWIFEVESIYRTRWWLDYSVRRERDDPRMLLTWASGLREEPFIEKGEAGGSPGYQELWLCLRCQEHSRILGSGVQSTSPS